MCLGPTHEGSGWPKGQGPSVLPDGPGNESSSEVSEQQREVRKGLLLNFHLGVSNEGST